MFPLNQFETSTKSHAKKDLKQTPDAGLLTKSQSMSMQILTPVYMLGTVHLKNPNNVRI